MLNLKILSFLCLLFSACVDKIPDLPAPDHLIEKDKMVDVLTELVQLESSAQLKYVQVAKYSKILNKTGDSLIKSKGFTVKSFEESMDYYGAKQDEMIEIYEEVKLRLIKEKKRLDSEVSRN